MRARVVRCRYLACQHVADPLNPQGMPSYYQTRWWARVELDSWRPRHEMVARRLIAPRPRPRHTVLGAEGHRGPTPRTRAGRRPARSVAASSGPDRDGRSRGQDGRRAGEDDADEPVAVERQACSVAVRERRAARAVVGVREAGDQVGLDAAAVAHDECRSLPSSDTPATARIQAARCALANSVSRLPPRISLACVTNGRGQPHCSWRSTSPGTYPLSSSTVSSTANPIAIAVSIVRGEALVSTNAYEPSRSPTVRASATPGPTDANHDRGRCPS
jgi:hypothetical protein